MKASNSPARRSAPAKPPLANLQGPSRCDGGGSLPSARTTRSPWPGADPGINMLVEVFAGEVPMSPEYRDASTQKFADSRGTTCPRLAIRSSPITAPSRLVSFWKSPAYFSTGIIERLTNPDPGPSARPHHDVQRAADKRVDGVQKRVEPTTTSVSKVRLRANAAPVRSTGRTSATTRWSRGPSPRSRRTRAVTRRGRTIWCERSWIKLSPCWPPGLVVMLEYAQSPDFVTASDRGVVPRRHDPRRDPDPGGNDWQNYAWPLDFFTILWGCCIVAVVAATLAADYHGRLEHQHAPGGRAGGRRVRRRPGCGGRPSRPWYKSGILSFSMTVSLVSVVGVTAIASAVMLGHGRFPATG